MKAISLILLLATVAWAAPYTAPYSWEHPDTALISFYALWRAHPDSIGSPICVDTTQSMVLTAVVPRESVLWVTAIDTFGVESIPSNFYYLYRLPPPPFNLRMSYQFNITIGEETPTPGEEPAGTDSLRLDYD